MHYLYRYVCILNVFFYMCIWTIVCNKEFILFIYRLKSIYPHRVLLTLYNTLILPHFNYCILSWGYRLIMGISSSAFITEKGSTKNHKY